MARASRASKSTRRPLPSSPHWPPMTTRTGTGVLLTGHTSAPNLGGSGESIPEAIGGHKLTRQRVLGVELAACRMTVTPCSLGDVHSEAGYRFCYDSHSRGAAL